MVPLYAFMDTFLSPDNVKTVAFLYCCTARNMYTCRVILTQNYLVPRVKTINCILTVQHGYRVAEIGHIALELELEPVPGPSLEHERGLAPLEQPPPWSLGCTFGVVGTDLGEHVGGVGPVVLGGIAGPDGHEGVES